MTRHISVCLALAAGLLLIGNTACSGGGSSSNSPGPTPPPAPPPQAASIAVSPTSVTVPAGAQQQFTAKATPSKSSLIWTVNGVPGGNAIVGTVSNKGLYTAPSSPPAAGQVEVKVTLKADQTKSAAARVSTVFSNASLKGSYVFSAVVVDAAGFTFAGGVLKSDGMGGIVDGIEDRNSSVDGPTTNLAVSGTYSVGSDGRGVATISNGSGSATFSFVLASSKGGQMIQFDSSSVSSGAILQQDPTAISDVAGTYVFGFQGQAITPTTRQSMSSVGQLVFAGSGAASGTEDLNEGSTQATLPFSATYVLGANGRGQLNLTNSWGSKAYAFYIVDRSKIELVSIDPNPGLIEAGVAVAQQNIPYSNSSLGSTAVLLSGVDPCNESPFVSAARFDTDGAGTILNGVLDQTYQGVFTDGASLSGVYNVDANGRGTASFTSSAGTVNFVFWLASVGNAQFMALDTGVVAGGVALSQKGLPFSNTSLQGNFALALTGTSGSVSSAALARVNFSGTGTFGGKEDVNVGSAMNAAVPLTGTYSVGSDGHGTASMTGLGTVPLRLHQVNQSEAIFISADPTQPVIGLGEKQCSDCH
ncbi:MAG TPA: Ig-like domain-containing protein [Terriglobales bacterium]|nr:Ig-like domain-containing protein [Terriglobales bacterium]